MKELHLLPTEERRQFFAVAVDTSGILFPIIEKDFWVVWTLERLFSLPDLKDHLTFKGGTSLSKVYGLIDRFSEDIDLSIEKEFFGFGNENDPEKAASKKKQRAALDGLAAACAAYVQNDLLKVLSASIAERMGTTEGWRLYVEPEDTDGQTLQFEYPAIVPGPSYIRQSVKIEMGARSEHWPVSQHPIQSYAKEALQEKMIESVVVVKVLDAARTFWEKATLLHQYAHLPAEKPLPPRLSRHLYDFFKLLNSAIKDKALSDLTLLDRVAAHKSIYFASGWANYGTARKGSLRLSPLDRVLAALEEDYELMTGMFYGKPRPEWKLILETIKTFETEFNLLGDSKK